MVEIENKGVENNEPKTAEQLSQELIAKIQNTEFGSPIHLAWRDHFEEIDLYDNLFARREDFEKAREKSKDLTRSESDLRIVEMEMALLRNDVRRRKHELPGYSEESVSIEFKEGKIAFAAGQEIEAKYQNETKDKQESLTENLYQSLMAEVKHEACFGKGKQA